MPKRQIWELQNEVETLRLRAESVKRQLAFLGLEPKAIQKLEQADLTQSASLVDLVQTVPVRAPTAGLIVGFHVVPGQVVHRDEPLFEIHDLSRVWVKGYVYERDASRVEPGQPAHVHFPAYPDLEAIGKVVRISPLMDDNERVLPVWVEVANPEHRLKDGMLARVTLMAKPEGEDAKPGVAQLTPIKTRQVTACSHAVHVAKQRERQSMLNHIIAFCLKNRVLVLAVTVVLVIYGSRQATQLPIDVFPNLNRPTVTIMTEAHGLAPEEVETLVTFPIESAMNGASDVRRVRSASGIGLSIVWVEFDWGTDIYIDRQIVSEKLQLVRERLPEEARPVMAPITSIMGEILLVGMQATGKTTPMELRTIADWEVRQRLLAVTGVSQVSVMGGEMKQYQVLTSPERLSRHDVTLDQLTRGGRKVEHRHRRRVSAEQEPRIADPHRRPGDHAGRGGRHGGAGRRSGADHHPRSGRRAVRRPGAPRRREHRRPTVGHPFGPETARRRHARAGRDASTKRWPSCKQRLPDDVVIVTDIFRQADFIEAAIDNVREAIRDGVVWVIVVLFIFLWNLRTSLITLTAIPLSIIITALAFSYFGISINTMTLGGLAVAIGELVDDSIVDIENIFRRLKENFHKPNPDNPLKVIFLASCEVRNSIVYATLIVVLVVFPLFSLAGLEGRMFAPLGLAYIMTLLASLVVSLTVTPVLASYLLPKARFLRREGDPFLLRWLKWLDGYLLRFSLRHSTAVLAVVAVLVLAVHFRASSGWAASSCRGSTRAR